VQQQRALESESELVLVLGLVLKLVEQQVLQEQMHHQR
jgi:hypothetical protein